MARFMIGTPSKDAMPRSASIAERTTRAQRLQIALPGALGAVRAVVNHHLFIDGTSNARSVRHA